MRQTGKESNSMKIKIGNKYWLKRDLTAWNKKGDLFKLTFIFPPTKRFPAGDEGIILTYRMGSRNIDYKVRPIFVDMSFNMKDFKIFFTDRKPSGRKQWSKERG